MNYKKALELYCGRPIDMLEDCRLQEITVQSGDEYTKQIIIAEWNIQDIEQPSIDDLIMIYESNKIDILKADKEKQLEEKYFTEALKEIVLKNYKPFKDKKTELDALTTEQEIENFEL